MRRIAPQAASRSSSAGHPIVDPRFFHEAHRIRPLKRFAASLRSHRRGMVAHAAYPIHTGRLEGVNNKIKLIKRRSYGFRDPTYFTLKVKQAFPGI